jgi:reactive intermediate/imine deaminase
LQSYPAETGGRIMRGWASAIAAATVFGLAAPAMAADAPPPTRLPFSEAVEVNGVLYLSGQIGNVPGQLKLVPGGFEPEARQAMDNIGAALRRHGASFDDVFKCTVFLADIKNWPAFNAIYVPYFKPDHPLPTRSAVGVTGLAIGASVEVECWARAPGMHRDGG